MSWRGEGRIINELETAPWGEKFLILEITTKLQEELCQVSI